MQTRIALYLVPAVLLLASCLGFDLGVEQGALCDGPQDCPVGKQSGQQMFCGKTGPMEIGHCYEKPTCQDHILNGSETGTDCGGDQCPACDDGKGCLSASDCTSHLCSDRVCAVPNCIDDVKNGHETDVDCGGPCGKCAAAMHCLVDTDCQSGTCADNKLCVAASCKDRKTERIRDRGRLRRRHLWPLRGWNALSGQRGLPVQRVYRPFLPAADLRRIMSKTAWRRTWTVAAPARSDAAPDRCASRERTACPKYALPGPAWHQAAPMDT